MRLIIKGINKTILCLFFLWYGEWSCLLEDFRDEGLYFKQDAPPHTHNRHTQNQHGDTWPSRWIEQKVSVESSLHLSDFIPLIIIIFFFMGRLKRNFMAQNWQKSLNENMLKYQMKCFLMFTIPLFHLISDAWTRTVISLKTDTDRIKIK